MATSSGTMQPDDAERRLLEDAAKEAERRREALHAAVVDVTAALESSPRGDDAWFAAVREALTRLDERLRRHVREAETPDGLLAEIVHRQPSYARRTEAMHAEHETMVARAAALVALASGPVNVDDLVDAITALVELVDRHRHKALELVIDAHNLDVAAGD